MIPTNSKLKAFALAAIVASIAVLAVLPAEDVSAEPSVSYDRTTATTTYISATFDSPVMYVYLTVDDGTYIGFLAETSPVTEYSFAMRLATTEARTIIPDGTYSYVLTDMNTHTVLKQGDDLTIAAVPTYEIEIASGIQNGTVSTDVSTAKAGDTVTVTATPSTGYVLEKIAVVAADDSEVSVSDDGKFTMPAQAVTVSATFTAMQHTVTIVQPDVGGTISATPLSAAQGATVELSNVPADGYEFVSYSVKDANNEDVTVTDGKFTMPASNVTVTATFKSTAPAFDTSSYSAALTEYIGGSEKMGATVPGGEISYAQLGGVSDAIYAAYVAVNGATSAETAQAALESGEASILKALQDRLTEFLGVTYNNGSAYYGKVMSKDVYDAGVAAVAAATVPEAAIAAYESALDSRTEATVEDSGISAGGQPYTTIQAAIDAVAEDATVSVPGIVTVSKDITEDITLAKNVRVDVTKDGSYTGTITYGDSVVKVVKLGDKSDVKIRGGSVEISGDFAGDSEFEVTAGTAVLSGTIAKDTDIKVTVADGATLQIGDLKVFDDEDTQYFTTSSLQLIYNKDSEGKALATIDFQDGTTYVGPAAVDSEEQVIDNIAYNEGSRIYFKEGDKDVYENIYHLISGAVDITVGVADIVVDYTGAEITDSIVRTATVRVDSYTNPYEPTSAAVPYLVEKWHEGASIMAPGAYDKAVEVFVVGGQGAQGLSRVLLANLTINPIPTHDITWANYDGTVIKTEKVSEGTVPAYTGDTPVREADAQYTYTFTGWDPTPVAVTGDATYTAQYSREVRSYTITWQNEDGTVLATDTVKYGDTPVYTGATPVKESDEGKDYTFDAWTPEIVPVTGDATYTATYKEGAREYNITWANYDGTVLATDKVAYGETPAYTGETPTRVDGRYDYTFSGWNPEVVPVTGDATYTAQYTSSPKDMYIWLHETVSIRGTSTEKIVKYTVNQLKDLDENLTNGKASETSKLVVDGKFYLPDTQATEGDWTLIVNKDAENQVVSGTYRSGSVYLIDEDDISTDGVIHFYALGADTPSTETQSITIAATGYYADADVAKDAINSAIKGLGLTSEITDVEKDTMFVIWYHATGGTFTGTLTFNDANGEAVTCDLGQHTSDKAGYGIFYFTSYKHEDGSPNGYVEGFEKYVAGSQYTITIADGDVSAKIIAGNSGSDTPAPSTETSTEVRAALVVDDDGVYLMMVAKDGKAIPDGTISVTYSFTRTTTFHGQQRTVSDSATFTQDYTSDGNAYAYVLLDFAGKAAENYDSVFGISAASFTYGQTVVNAGSASFTLPAIARA